MHVYTHHEEQETSGNSILDVCNYAHDLYMHMRNDMGTKIGSKPKAINRKTLFDEM